MVSHVSAASWGAQEAWMDKGVVWKHCWVQAVVPMWLQALLHWAFLIFQLADSASLMGGPCYPF